MRFHGFFGFDNPFFGSESFDSEIFHVLCVFQGFVSLEIVSLEIVSLEIVQAGAESAADFRPGILEGPDPYDVP